MSAPTHYIAVGNHDGPPINGEPLSGPIVFEQYLSDCTLESAKALLQCKAMEQCGGGRLAMLDFDLSNGDPEEPHVVIAGFDGVYPERGPLVWETYIPPGRHGREKALQNAASIERRYGASTVARVVYTDDDGRPL